MQVISSHVVKMSRLNHIYYNYNYYNCMVNNLNKRHDFISNFVNHVTVLFVLWFVKGFDHASTMQIYELQFMYVIIACKVKFEKKKKESYNYHNQIIVNKKNKSCWAISHKQTSLPQLNHHYLIFLGRKNRNISLILLQGFDFLKTFFGQIWQKQINYLKNIPYDRIPEGPIQVDIVILNYIL